MLPLHCPQLFKLWDIVAIEPNLDTKIAQPANENNGPHPQKQLPGFSGRKPVQIR